MITKIVAKLKTGSIKSVVPYGIGQKPAPPYVVVKPERDPIGRGRLFVISAHFNEGQIIFLEDYIFNEVQELLDNYKTVSRHNNYNQVLTEPEYQDIISNNDDGTVSMERVFLVPSRIF